MLNRRHIRIKVLQALYAAIQSDNTDITLGQKRLMIKLDKVYDLAIYQMSVLIEVRDFAALRFEEAKNKHFPTEEELNPNTRFIDNSFLKQLEENIDYQKRIDNLAVNWVTETDMIRKMYLSLVDTEAYQKYLRADEVPYKVEKELIMYMFEEIITPNKILHALFEEKDINWGDDYNLASELVLMIISSFKLGWSENKVFPPLFKDDDSITGNSQDRMFARDLFANVLRNSEKYDKLIIPKTKNWDIDRLAVIDRILIYMALSEITEMSTIPIKVSMNEYIDLSKFFSTPKSKIFINGILDSIVADLKTTGNINKQGRGLMG